MDRLGVIKENKGIQFAISGVLLSFTPDIQSRVYQLLSLAFDNIERPIHGPFTLDEFRMCVNKDIKASMKFTFGSDSIGVSWFLLSSVFVYFFNLVSTHCTKTMWICKEIPQVLDNVLYLGWDVKEGVLNIQMCNFKGKSGRKVPSCMWEFLCLIFM